MAAKALLRWGYDRVWDKWPVMLVPVVRKFRRMNGYWPDLLTPRTFNEKVLWRMLFDRRPVLPILASKVTARDFVRGRLGSDTALVPLIGIVRSPAEVRGLHLPPQFAMKAAHGSQMVHIQRADAPLDIDRLERLCEEWLGNDFGKYAREWIYKPGPRAVVVEKLLQDASGGIPPDYKIFCYDGRVGIIDLISNRFAAKTRDLFDRDWTFIPVPVNIPNSAHPPPRPDRLEAIVAMAETLAQGLDFVRVDLYDTPGGLRFGEMTTTPNAGTMNFPSREMDLFFGAPWTLPTWRARQSASG